MTSRRLPPFENLNLNPIPFFRRILRLRKTHGRPQAILPDGSIITRTTTRGPVTWRRIQNNGSISATHLEAEPNSFNTFSFSSGFICISSQANSLSHILSITTNESRFTTKTIGARPNKIQPDTGTLWSITGERSSSLIGFDRYGTNLGHRWATPIGMGIRISPLSGISFHPNGTVAASMQEGEIVLIHPPGGQVAFSTERRSSRVGYWGRTPPRVCYSAVFREFIWAFDDGELARWAPPQLGDGSWFEVSPPVGFMNLGEPIRNIVSTPEGILAQVDGALVFLDSAGRTTARLEAGRDVANEISWTSLGVSGLIRAIPASGVATDHLYDSFGKLRLSLTRPSRDFVWFWPIGSNELLMVHERSGRWDVGWISLVDSFSSSLANIGSTEVIYAEVPQLTSSSLFLAENSVPDAPTLAALPKSTVDDPTFARLLADIQPPSPRLRRTTPWYHVSRTSDRLPFSFRASHPVSFDPSDFAVWVAFNPRDAEKVFSVDLVAVFQYSWKALLQLTSRDLHCSDEYEYARVGPPSGDLEHEFRSWGWFLFSLWKIRLTHEPPIYKRIGQERHWKSFAPWTREDGLTPCVYRFEELAENPRDFILLDDEEDDPWEKLPEQTLSAINLGVQVPDEFATLSILMPGWGYSSDGSLSYIGPAHDEWKHQRETD